MLMKKPADGGQPNAPGSDTGVKTLSDRVRRGWQTVVSRMPSARIQVLGHFPAESDVEDVDEEASKRWPAEYPRLGYRCYDTFRPGSKKMAETSGITFITFDSHFW